MNAHSKRSLDRLSTRALLLLLVFAASCAFAVLVSVGAPAKAATYSWPTVKRGASGENVYSIQYMLKARGYSLSADGAFGSITESNVKRFQSSRGLTADGIVGARTWPALVVTTRSGSRGDAVRALQRQLNQQGSRLAVDGIFGSGTQSAVSAYQKSRCLSADGIAGPQTWSALALDKAASSSCGGTGGGGDGTLPTPSFGSSIEALAAYDPQRTCDQTAKPGVVGYRDLILRTFPTTGDSGISRSCTSGGTSEHKEGRAWDWRVYTTSSADRARVDKVFSWLFATDRYGNKYERIRRLGVMYIIWDGRIWSSSRASEGWRNYPCSGTTACHRDHVHFSFSKAGASKQTSWWTQQ